MDLICYTYPGWAPRLRPAGPKRDWMEQTPERFAYRCLPLAIANAHGWEVLSPCGFSARWTGGSGPEAVEVRVDSGTDPRQAPVSLFGQGTITFHVEGVFRTPEGWNLWVGGSPNQAKDGIAPLGGVIETDWSPYTFTMNWRFTRAHQWVRFEENEPFCFLFPVQRQLVETVEPKILPMSEEPGLTEQFETWSRSRDAFQRWVEENCPSAPTDKWQKLYYRGVLPDGGPGPKGHRAKLRLKPFVDADGNGAEPPSPASCPRQTAPGAAAPAAIRAYGASAAGNPALSIALQRIGFDAVVQDAKTTTPALGLSPGDGGLTERRRDWILAAMERQRGLSARASQVARVRDLSGEEFLDLHYAPGRPVVIEGALDRWPALARWNPDYLKRKLGDAVIEYQTGREANPDFELNKDLHKARAPFSAFIERIRNGGNDIYLTASNSAANRAALKPLRKDLGRLDQYLSPGEGMAWIGPAGTFTPLHFDLTNNLIAQIVGRKQILLVPPAETARLYNRRHVFSDVHDLTDADRLARFPLAREVTPYEVELAPGDLVFIPVGWWHQVRARDFSVTLTYTNFRWPNDAWESFPADPI